jgi:hypothetical protein
LTATAQVIFYVTVDIEASEHLSDSLFAHPIEYFRIAPEGPEVGQRLASLAQSHLVRRLGLGRQCQASARRLPHTARLENLSGESGQAQSVNTGKSHLSRIQPA